MVHLEVQVAAVVLPLVAQTLEVVVVVAMVDTYARVTLRCGALSKTATQRIAGLCE